MADQQEPICPLAEAAEAARGWRPPRARSGAGGACCRAELAGAPGQLYSTWLCASVCFGQHPLTRDVLRAHKPHPSRRLGAAAALGPLRPQPPPQPVDPGGGLVAEGEVHSGREEAEELFITRARRAPLRNLREARHGVRRDTVSGATRCQARHGVRREDTASAAAARVALAAVALAAVALAAVALACIPPWCSRCTPHAHPASSPSPPPLLAHTRVTWASSSLTHLSQLYMYMHTSLYIHICTPGPAASR